MKSKDKRLTELYKWASQKPERQNIPTIMNHAIQRYKVKEDTARNYAIQIMIKLGKLSQPMKVSDIYRMWEKDRSSPSHYPRRKSLLVGDEDFYRTEFVKASELADN